MFRTASPTRTARPSPARPGATTYQRKKAAAAERSRGQSKAGREIGPLPAVADPRRRARCAASLLDTCRTYFAGRFPLPFGPDHLDLIGDLQRVITEGGQQAEAHPRGSGKTTICEVAAVWAILNGYRSFVVLIGASEDAANELLQNIKAEVESNDLLAADYPEACYPVARLEGIHNRAKGQRLDGKPTRIEWKDKRVILPTVPGAKCSGATVKVAGITGRIRGSSRMIGGRKVRPDLVIIDDPQTDESARSPIQNDTRERILSGAVLGLAGPTQRIAAIVPCTVIRPGDMADRILDRGRHPEWHGRRCRLLRSMPGRLDLWDQYAELLRDGLRKDPPDRAAATAFYAAHRAEMDRGAEASWPARHDPDQLSALQYAMDLYLIDPLTFWAEFQNEPRDESGAEGAEPIDPFAAAEKLNRTPRGHVPPDCGVLTAGIDLQEEILFWAVCGWSQDFRGAVVDYGTYPQQPVSRFTASDPNPSLSTLPGNKERPLEARVYGGLEAIARTVLARDWPREGGGPPLRVTRAGVDTGHLSDTVHQWCRQTAAAAVVMPTKGVFIGATKTPVSEWKKAKGDLSGPGWRIKAAGSPLGRPCLVDTNHWKSFLAERVRSDMGAPGSFTLFGTSPAAHATFCDHLAAEYPVRATADGRTVDEWQLRPGRPDNHWFDCAVYAAAAASREGCRWSAAAAAGEPDHRPAPAKPISLKDLRAKVLAERRKAG